MGFFRGGIVLMLGILLFFSFLTMNSFFILQSSLKYENVKTGLYPILKNISETQAQQIIPKEIMGEFNLTDAARDVFNKAKNYCRNQNNIQYNFSYEGYSIGIPCENVSSSSPEAMITETYDDVIYDIYYKEYDCKFWDCFSKTELPFFLVSEKARDYWKEKFYFSLLASLILITLIFLFTDEKRNTPITVGILLILSAFPLLKLKDLLYAVAGNFSSMINLFLSSTRSVFMFSLMLGALLVGTGVALRFWNPEAIKEKLSVKEVKDIVKTEIARENVKQAQKQMQKKQPKKKKRKGFLSKFLNSNK
ncbi:MAG: hypothetical protein Q8P79_02805 [Nanoarchaeota archaeon]|nr:hypothetical protein [Nanoarchaeota archaeon]